jgi:hypothetical protein
MYKKAVAIAILTAGAALAQDRIPALNAKTGLWEVTSVSVRSGAPPIPADALARMTPEQRAMIEAKMKAMPQTTTKQSCFTAEDVAKGFGLNHVDKSCKQTIVSANGSKLEVKWICDGPNNKGTGSIRIEAPDPTQVNGLVEFTMASEGRVMNMKVTTTAKWLSNSCGNVEPDSPK